MFCKYCGKQVEDGAIFCGNCGHKTNENNISSEKNKKTKGKKKIVIIIGLIVLVLIIIAVCFIFRNKLLGKADSKVNTITQNNPTAHTYTEEEKQNMIGKYVNYKPTNGNYTAKARLTGVDEYDFINGIQDQIFSTEKDIKWKIWDIDDKNIMLISDKPTTKGGHLNNGTLCMYGKIGYQNAVSVLDELCNTCYKNSRYEGIEVRSLGLEDIEKVLDKSIWEPKIYIDEAIKDGIDEGYVNIQADGWSNEMSNSNYKSDRYYEMIHKFEVEIESYYIAHLVHNYAERTNGYNEAMGIQTVENEYVNWQIFYEKDEYSVGDNATWASIRPMIIIPLESCKLNIDNLNEIMIEPVGDNAEVITEENEQSEEANKNEADEKENTDKHIYNRICNAIEFLEMSCIPSQYQYVSGSETETEKAKRRRDEIEYATEKRFSEAFKEFDCTMIQQDGTALKKENENKSAVGNTYHVYYGSNSDRWVEVQFYEETNGYAGWDSKYSKNINVKINN